MSLGSLPGQVGRGAGTDIENMIVRREKRIPHLVARFVRLALTAR